MQPHHQMQDVAGRNGAEADMTASNSDRINFSDLLGKKIGKGLQPISNVSDINPRQMSGVGISGITPNMPKGNIINTGNPLDLAIKGDGYFVLSDGKQNIYTHSVSLKVDTNASLVDSVTGYTIRRIGSDGEGDGFQIPGDHNVRVPYGAVMSANRTSQIKVSGNLSSDATLAGGPRTQQIASNITYTSNGDTLATSSTEFGQLDQFNGGSGIDGRLEAGESGTITISGYNTNGTALSSGLTFSVNPATTLGEFINHLNTNVLSGATASLVGGKIQITDDTGGCSRTDISLSYSGNGSLTMPGYFEILTVGGEEVKNAGITIYDSQGNRHVLTGAFVRGIRPNTWDMVLKSVTGDVGEITMTNRRIENICFNASDGSYAGLSGSDSPQFVITFANDLENPQTIKVQMGTVSGLDGLTQFKGNSTAAASEQDGYEAGRLSNVSVNNEGLIIGGFSNGIEKNIAGLQIALFQNASGLESIGGGYFVPSADSGDTVAAGAITDGDCTVHSGVLEKLDATVATEFVNMVQAQSGFQTNVRTISVANEILREMSNPFG